MAPARLVVQVAARQFLASVRGMKRDYLGFWSLDYALAGSPARTKL